jgi:hypothetical protein
MYPVCTHLNVKGFVKVHAAVKVNVDVKVKVNVNVNVQEGVHERGVSAL